MLVDPRKLDQVRELIDFEIMRLQTEFGLRQYSAMECLSAQLDWLVEFFKVDDWYIATAQHIEDRVEMIRLADKESYGLAAQVDVETRVHVAIASTAYAAGTSVLCRLVDDECDVFMDDETIAEFYPYSIAQDAFEAFGLVEQYLLHDVWFQDVPQWCSTSKLFEIKHTDCGTISPSF